jgi:hypothetical protein
MDDQFEKILDRYLQIQASLAGDSNKGIDAAAQSISQLAASIQTSEPQIQTLIDNLQRQPATSREKSLRLRPLSRHETEDAKPAYQGNCDTLQCTDFLR